MTVRDITSNYFLKHRYYLDVFDCDQMSADLWDQVMAANITAKIVLGNSEKPVSIMDDVNHAWVIAEISPGQWLALDPTSGGYILKDWNPYYYRGLVFDNPIQMMIYLNQETGEPAFTNITPAHLPFD